MAAMWIHMAVFLLRGGVCLAANMEDAYRNTCDKYGYNAGK